MAFKLNADAQTVFFAKVFGADHLVTTQVKGLIAVGVSFEVALYTVKALYKGKASHVTLTTGTTSLMKATVDGLIMGQNKTLIQNWVTELCNEVGLAASKVTHTATVPTQLTVLGVPANAAVKPNLIELIKAIRIVTGLGLKDAKLFAEHILAGHSVPLTILSEAQTPVQTLHAAGVQAEWGTPWTPDEPVETAVLHQKVDAAKMPVVKPTSTVMHLKDAQALGQPVHGTSNGSVYHTIALSKSGVKIAARMKTGGAISIRAEWTGNPQADLLKLTSSGVQMKANYGSIHFDAAGVPMPKVIGAFLIGSGIDWAALVTNGAELVIGEGV